MGPPASLSNLASLNVRKEEKTVVRHSRWKCLNVCVYVYAPVILARRAKSQGFPFIAKLNDPSQPVRDIATFFEQPLQYGGCISDFQNHCCNLISKEVAAAILKIANCCFYRVQAEQC